MTLVIKNVNEEKLREFKAEAIRRGLTLSEAIDQAMDLWLNRVRDNDERQENNKVFNKLKNEILSKYKDKYVIIAQGKFIGAYDSIDQVEEVLKKLNVKHAIVFNPSKDIKSEGEWLGGSLLQ